MPARARPGPLARRETRTALALVAPALSVVLLGAILPLGWTFWESLHVHDLRMPWLGRPFAGAANYVEALSVRRFWDALGHTVFFAAASVACELGLGLALALALHGRFRGRGLARTAAILPWAIPTVVAALVWRFLFEGPGAPAGALVRALGLAAEAPAWLAHPRLAWVPLVLADVWKTTPFVVLLLLAGLQAIDPELYEAARMDRASAWQRFRHVTWPLLRPAFAVALVFRSLDALRVFDLVYVLTGGGPGTATEPLALYAFQSLFQELRFGYGSAVSMLLFAVTFAFALAYLRRARRVLLEDAG
jgi:ABC-type sugar transport system permease subunit